MTLFLSFGASWQPGALSNYVWTGIDAVVTLEDGALDTRPLWSRRRELVADPGIFLALKKESLGAIRQLEQHIAWSENPF